MVGKVDAAGVPPSISPPAVRAIAMAGFSIRTAGFSVSLSSVARALFTLSVLLAFVTTTGCKRSNGYSQETPDAVVRTAKLMVERGDASQLHELIYAENDDMRGLLRRLGRALGHLQDLGTEIAKAFPKEIAELKAQTEAAAKKGKATGLLQQLTSQAGFRGRGRPKVSGKDQKEKQELFNSAIKRLFADPYGFLEDTQGRLTTAEISDDLAAIMWDNAPILPPVGLTMRHHTAEEGMRWSVVLPLNLPFLANYAPRTTSEYKVLGSMVRTFDNAILDLTKDIQAKRISSLDQVSKRAGEKLFVPAVMTFYAYSKVVEARKKAVAPNSTKDAPSEKK